MQLSKIRGVVLTLALIAPAAQVVADPAPPDAPAALQAPDGNKLYFALDADGVQIYQCRAANGAIAWGFVAPEATLYDDDGAVAGTHYAGPTWEGDNGKVVGGLVTRVNSTDPTAIPWLLLRAVANAGNGPFSKVTFIQRLETGGGRAPATGCDASTLGSEARVHYVARYYFYKAKP